MPPYRDRTAEFRPYGEATQIPDPQLETDHAEYGDGIAERDYPAGGERDTDICQSCERAISSTQRQCRFCLQQDVSVSDSASEPCEQTLHGIICLLVPSQSPRGALAKGTAAARLLQKSHSSPIDECTLIAALEQPIAAPLRTRWGHLPDIVPATGSREDGFVAKARSVSLWSASPSAEVLFRDGTTLLGRRLLRTLGVNSYSRTQRRGLSRRLHFDERLPTLRHHSRRQPRQHGNCSAVGRVASRHRIGSTHATTVRPQRGLVSLSGSVPCVEHHSTDLIQIPDIGTRMNQRALLSSVELTEIV